MKRIFFGLGVVITMMFTACTTSEAEKEKGAMDSIAATPNPIHTDTLRSIDDKIRADSLPK